MAVTIPLTAAGASTKITLRSSSARLTPFLGGPVQSVSRIADRWVVEVELRPMSVDQAGVILAALARGLSETVIVPIHTGFTLKGHADGAVEGVVTGGSQLTFTGGGSATKKIGQFFSIVKDGSRYLHQITAVSGSTINFIPMLRTPLVGGEVLEFGAPKIEGFIEGNEQSWQVGRLRDVGVSFRVMEAL